MSVQVTINGYNVSVEEGTSILNAAKQLDIKIPTLCYHPDQIVKGNCRVCVVEVEGMRNLAAACCTPVKEGMIIRTNSKRVRDARRTVVELIMAGHNQECLTCVRNGNCELQDLCSDLNIHSVPFDNVSERLPIDDSNPSIERDMSKCIKCGRCVQVCNCIQTVGAIYNVGRSSLMHIAPAFEKPLNQVPCVYCGQCINVCPVGAIYEKNDVDKVLDVLEDKTKHVVVQIAPAVRVSLGEEFGMEPGSIITGKIVTALRMLGFDKVFDTDFAADLTIIEEGNELIDRLNNNGKLPMITSCSPGWIRYIEYFYPEFLENLSTCKSPQQMFGAIAKSYYAEKEDIDPAHMTVVSIMPCTAKKAEAVRDEMKSCGYQDVDYVLTTRELGSMIKKAGIELNELREEAFDVPLGITTGAGVIFGATGGVMEAALRTVYEVVTNEELNNINFTQVRGLEGVKESEIPVGDLKVKVAVAHGLSHARELLERLKRGEAEYHFIEIMCCPGGCIGGGGQPKPLTNEIREKRIKAIYEADLGMPLRRSHNNPAIQALYDDFLEQPLGEKSHHLLHTHYTERKKYELNV